jgi:hypothetical protein
MTTDEAAVRARVRETQAAMRRAARDQARRAIEGTIGGADTRSRGQRETIRAGERITVIEGSDPLDDMKDQLTAAEWNAGLYLRDLWRDCLPGMEMPGTYGTGAGHGGQRHLSGDEQAAAARAWHDYCGAMSHLEARAGLRVAAAVRSVCMRFEDAPLGLVRDGLGELGRLWRMK